MPKEVIAAIVVGGLLGIAIAFGVWRANIALSPQKEPTATQATQNPTSIPTPETLSLTIISPENETVVDSATVTVTGLAAPDVAVAISTEIGETITTSDSKGSFSGDVEVTEGANVITVTAFDEDGETIEKQITVVYSTELQ